MVSFKQEEVGTISLIDRMHNRVVSKSMSVEFWKRKSLFTIHVNNIFSASMFPGKHFGICLLNTIIYWLIQLSNKKRKKCIKGPD